MAKTYVKTTKHPKKDIFIKCYTKSTYYQKMWNSDTINARGHVVDSHDNLLSTPFKKIFNIDEHATTEKSHLIQLLNDNWNEVEEHKKWNGHLCIMFHDGEEWINTTKGSFTHDFVELDRTVIESSGYTEEVLSKIPKNWTLMFEIVADYDKHLMTDHHIHEIGDEHAVLIGVNDRNTSKTIKGYREKILSLFDESDKPIIPSSRRVSDDIFIDDLGDDERKDVIEEYIESVLAREQTEGAVLFIPSLDYRVKLKTKWFIYNRYLHQFNAERTKNIFEKYEDSEEAFNKIPEELHPYYQRAIDGYYSFSGLYKEQLMEAFESLCKAYKTKEELELYINSAKELGELEKKAMLAFLNNKGLQSCIRDLFMVHYSGFDLVGQIDLY